MDCIVHGAKKSQTQLSDFHFHFPGLPWSGWWLNGKESICQCKKHGFEPQSGKIPWRRNGNLLQYSWLGNPMDRGAWWDTVHGVSKDQAWLKCQTMAAKNEMEERDINMQSSGLLPLILLGWFIHTSTVNAECANPVLVGATPVRTVTWRSRASHVIPVGALPPSKRDCVIRISSPATAVTNSEGSCLTQQKSLFPQI